MKSNIDRNLLESIRKLERRTGIKAAEILCFGVSAALNMFLSGSRLYAALFLELMPRAEMGNCNRAAGLVY